VTPALVAAGLATLTPIRRLLHRRARAGRLYLLVREELTDGICTTDTQATLDRRVVHHSSQRCRDGYRRRDDCCRRPSRPRPLPVRAFRTFTPDLHELVAWLAACGIDTVAMESTGVYWVPIYELLEAQGILPYLINARHVRMVPGRKTDWNDAQWLQKLHALGLLPSSFRPDAESVALRTLSRYRAEVIQHRSPHVNQMQQALKLMNIQLSEVLTDITGQTGMAILRAIVDGERDPVTLTRFRAASCRSSQEMIAKALTGTCKEEQIFVLQQALALYDAYTSQLAVCDTRIEQYLAAMESRGTPNAPPPEVPASK
jgi:transposase